MAKVNKMASSRWVGSHSLEDFKSDPNIDGKDMQVTIITSTGL